ncbi:MAG: hypothetical protein IBJ14_16190 [Hydrogenophaga sp.]|nr:hypothetical protein [Hydrogenophaga sp.]
MEIASVRDLFSALDTRLTESDKVELRALDADSLWKLHFGLNHAIRNLAFYGNTTEPWSGMVDRLVEPDGGSAVLGWAYWKRLRGEEITQADLTAAIERMGFWWMSEEESHTVASDLLTLM